MSLRREYPPEVLESLGRILGKLGAGLQRITVGSTRFLVYLVPALTIISIVGVDRLDYLGLSPVLIYVLKSVVSSPQIQRLVDHLGGDLLADKMVQLASEGSLTDRKALALANSLATEDTIERIIGEAFEKSGLLGEKDFFRFAARQLRENRKNTAMLEFLVNHALTSDSGRKPLQLPSRMLTENFVGREIELEQLTASLKPGNTIVIAGPGGIGKSALVAKALWEAHDSLNLEERFPDGVLYYDFSLQPDIRIASATIAESFGYSPTEDPNLLRTVFENKKALIILDSAENAAGGLAPVLRGSNTCTIIVTTRSTLEVPGLRIRLRRLSAPHGSELLGRWLGHTIASTPAAVRDLAEQLDGLPLAITLAGKCISRRSMNLAAYIEWYRQSLKSLELGSDRAHSVPLVLEESVRGVSEVARRILLVMGNCAFRPLTHVTLVAALQPLYQFPEADIQQALFELTDHHLVQIVKVAVEEGRYVGLYRLSHNLIHRYIREFASREWPEDWNIILDRVSPMLILAPLELAIREPRLRTFFSESLYLDAMVLQENLLEEGRLSEAASCSEILIRHGQMVGNRADNARILDNALKVVAKLDDKAAQASILIQIADLQFTLGDFGATQTQAERALALSREIGDREAEAKALEVAALAYYERGQPNEAYALQREAHDLADSLGNSALKCRIGADMGAALLAHGQPQHAVSQLRAVAELAKKEEYSSLLATVYLNLGTAQFAIHDYDGAVASLGESCAYALETDQDEILLSAEMRLGHLHMRNGKPDHALAHCQNALATARRLENQGSIAACCANLGLVMKALGRNQDATEYLGRALDVFERIDPDSARAIRIPLEELRQEE
jgi:tetratricopeptide (TPR) repeat protein